MPDLILLIIETACYAAMLMFFNNILFVAVWLIGYLYGIFAAFHWWFSHEPPVKGDRAGNIIGLLFMVVGPLFIWPPLIIDKFRSGTLKNIVVRWPIGRSLYRGDIEEVSAWLEQNCPRTIWSRPVMGHSAVYFFRRNDQMLFMLSGFGKLS